MPRRGGEADKLGNRYEGLWTVTAALDLIDGDYVDLTVEAIGDEATGVEFVSTTPSGVREYHSVKRQQGKGNWTLSRLFKVGPTGRSILGDLIAKVHAGSEGIFSSGTSASELAELIEHARATDSFEEFDARIRQNAKRSEQFPRYVVPICGNEDGAWSALRQLRVRTVDEATLTRDVQTRVRAMLRAVDGRCVDPKAARLLIGDFLTDNLGSRLTGESILNDLEAHGLVRSRLGGDATVRGQIQRRNRAHARDVRSRLINHEQIIRDETALASAALLEQGKSVVLEGAAGSGKSCVLVQLMQHLEVQDVPYLVIRLDTLESGDQHAQAIGTRLGLLNSPTITLGEFAGGQPSVLVVDQLDAISVVSARNQAALGAFSELLDEARMYPNMRIVFACRSFDFDRDPRLRELAEDRKRVERIPVGPLDEPVIRGAIVDAGFDPASLNQKQLEILSTPLHLHLLLESANSQDIEFTSAGDLYDAFWEHKAAAVSQRLDGNLSVWSDAVGRLSDELSRCESLVAPRLVLDEYVGALNVLASDGVVYVQNDNVGFFHESFFDYAFARAFVRSNRDLVQWLLDDEQHLFRRSQVRQVLEFLRGREADRGTYLTALRGLLSHSKIRFHIKKLVLDWLGVLPDPTSDEWRVVEGLAAELGDYAWAVPRDSVPWFDTLHAMGRWDEWLKSDDEQVNRALWLLLNVLDARSDAVAELVRGFRGTSDDWGGRLRRLIEGRHGRTGPEMQDFVIELIKDGTLDDARPGIAVNDDWWSTWYGLGAEQPEFGIRVLAAWFDRQLARAAALGKEDPFDDDLGLVTHSQYSGDLIRECAAAAPIEFTKELFPRLARFHSSVPKEWIVAAEPVGRPRRPAP